MSCGILDAEVKLLHQLQLRSNFLGVLEASMCAHWFSRNISCADLPPRCFLTGGCDGYAKIWKFQSAKPTPGREPLASWNGKEQLDSIRRYGRDDMGCHMVL